MSKLISIIMPSYNSQDYIEESINSVINQSYKNWELIIIDDKSTDNTVKIINRFMSSDKRIVLKVNANNSGPGKSRNTGIEMAKGSFLTFLDSDDIWYSNFLERSLSFEKKSEGFVFASYMRGDEFNLKPVYKDFIVPSKVKYLDILKTNSISCLTAFINIGKLGKKYMPEVRYRQDMGLWLKYLKVVDFAIGNKEVLAIYRIRKKSHSRNKYNLIKPQWNFYRKVEKLSLLKSLHIILIWSVRGILKYR